MKWALTILVSSLMLFNPLEKNEHYLIVGTYDSSTSDGIYVYRFNTLNAEVSSVSHIKSLNASYLTISPDQRFVFAVQETGKETNGGEVAAFAFDTEKGLLKALNRQPTNGDHPCFIETDKTGNWLFAANYSSGSISVFPVKSDGSISELTGYFQHRGNGKDPKRQGGPHAHCTRISPDNKKLYAADLGTDKIFIYDFDEESGSLKPARPAFVSTVGGSGPRHFIFHPTKNIAYLIEELSGTVAVFNVGSEFKQLQRISTMPAGDSGFPGSADIQISQDGKFLYASNRGDANSIAIFSIMENGELELKGYQSTFGKGPRNFTIDPSGQFLLVGNEKSNEIVIFERNIENGLLKDTGKRISVGKPVCLKWIKS